ncbi:MAG: hypothetical protein IPJ65_28435 [Archangiaceae bacterium]|nr:hypothetical protein [Archangiaceae bacterium]
MLRSPSACLAALLAAACSSTPAPVTEKDFAKRYEDTLCSQTVSKCCMQYSFVFDEALCRQNVQHDLAPASAGDAGYVFDEAQGGKCIAALEGILKSVDAQCVYSDAADMLGNVCESVWSKPGTVRYEPGSRMAGETCRHDEDCAAVTGKTVDCNGSCLVVAKVGAGEVCGTVSGERHDCSDGLECRCVKNSPLDPFCAQPQVDKCFARPMQGEACNGNCTGSWCNAVRVCAAYVAEGQACQQGKSDAIAKDFSNCAAGLYCDRSSSVCSKPKANMTACQTSGECQSNNCSGGRCLPDNLLASKDTCGG